MKRPIQFRPILLGLAAAALLSNLSSPANADNIELHRLLHGPERCDHVIGLLHRHGVNNDCDQPVAINTFHPLGHAAIPAAELGDLQLVSIARHAGTAAGCGPAMDVVIKNCSTRDVCGARITLVGLLGRICPTSPNVTSQIASIPAGQAVQVTMTLPIESLAMGNLNGQMIAFNRVLVAVDSYDQFMESNEANNLRVFDVSTIPAVPVAVETAAVETAAAAPVATDATAVADPSVTAPAAPVTQPVTAQPVTNEAPSAPANPATEISQSDLRSAIDQFSDDATAKQDAS